MHKLATVQLPAHAFTAHKLQRMFLTRRPNATRLRVSPAIELRRAWEAHQAMNATPRVYTPDPAPAPSQAIWTLSSVALMVAVVLACWAVV